MRILVLSDIHANQLALEAVLEDAGSFDAAWCLGDIVGYGPDPNECVEMVRSLPGLVCVLGNHDAAITGNIDSYSFNPEARISIEWTSKTLSAKNKKFLKQVPQKSVQDDITIVHASPRDPIHEYLLDRYTATVNFAHFDTDYGFFGHTHVPTIFHLNQGYADLYLPEVDVKFDFQPRLLINPGSVGQPRDRDPRAAYALYDTDTHSWNFRRITYPVEAVQERMRAANLPEKHIVRLQDGW